MPFLPTSRPAKWNSLVVENQTESCHGAQQPLESRQALEPRACNSHIGSRKARSHSAWPPASVMPLSSSCWQVGLAYELSQVKRSSRYLRALSQTGIVSPDTRRSGRVAVQSLYALGGTAPREASVLRPLLCAAPLE